MRHHEAASVHVGAESVGGDGPVVVGGPNCELIARILVVLAQRTLQICGGRTITNHRTIRIIVAVVQYARGGGDATLIEIQLSILVLLHDRARRHDGVRPGLQTAI